MKEFGEIFVMPFLFCESVFILHIQKFIEFNSIDHKIKIFIECNSHRSMFMQELHWPWKIYFVTLLIDLQKPYFIVSSPIDFEVLIHVMESVFSVFEFLLNTSFKYMSNI